MKRTATPRDLPEHNKPQAPRRKTSQSGYGHRTSTAGRTTPQGSGRNQPKKRAR